MRLILAILFLATTSFAAPQPGAWALAWSDEFDGTSVDTAKWNVASGARRDAINTPSAITVQSGYLTLKTYTSGGTHYTGWLGTDGKFDNAYGYWEARVRFHDSAGMWSAFWLQSPTINNTGNNPAANGAEIDVFEHRSQDSGGGNLTNSLSYNIHWDGYGADHKSVGTTVGNPGGSNLTDNWHTYGIRWTPTAYYFYIDGVQTWTTTSGVSNKEQWIYLTSEVESGAWAGAIPGGGYGSQAASVTKMDIDYVRFYARAEIAENGDFEGRFGTWWNVENAYWSAGNGANSSDGARLNPTGSGGASVNRIVYGLVPLMPYTLSGNSRVASATTMRIGAKNYGGSDTWGTSTAATFTNVNAPFIMGAANTTAHIYAYHPGAGDGYVDDFKLRRTASVTDGGFEQGSLAAQWSSYGNTLIHSWTPVRSGDFALRFNTSSSDRGIEQTVLGLEPSTTYKLTCWFRTDNQPMRLGVKNHGATASETIKTIYGNTWQRHDHTFTTGASATSATVYAWIPGANSNSVVDVDDFFLAESTVGWTRSDIGAFGLESNSGVRNSRTVIRGAGGDIWSTADSFTFQNQPMTGDGMITARLRTFESPAQAASKFGVMLRDTLAADSRHILAAWRGDGSAEIVRRLTTAGGANSDNSAAAMTAPWVRITRQGSTFTASYSPDGLVWTQLGSPQTMAVGATIYAGVAILSHDTTTLAEGSLDNLTITITDGDQDGMLDTWETSTFGNTAQTPSADADGDGQTNLTEFIAGTNAMNGASRFVATTAPAVNGYSINWTSVPGKTYTVQYAPNLSATWLSIAIVAGSAGATTSYTDTSATSQTQRYYRVVTQ